MSHYFTIPINTDGIVSDLNMARNFTNALNPPFDVTDVFIYSHGWWTSASRALSNYNQFSVELAATVGSIAKQTNSGLANLPQSPLGVAIHWPSMISDDDQALINKLEALSFYTMGHRANQVGVNAVYSLLRLIIEESPRMPRLHFLGHSFGCRVVCAAIQEILDDPVTIPGGIDLSINAVLLEAAFDANALEPNETYGGLSKMPNLRILVTHSGMDHALQHDYPLAQEINIFGGGGAMPRALGGIGPTTDTIKAFGGISQLNVGTGFSHSTSAVCGTRMLVADLTPLHTANASYPSTDHHSDIFLNEIYELISGFLFR